MEKKWWQKEVVYQIYPKSFKDSNHDGIGDIPGIIEKLDYLQDLGVTAIWLCPVYKSPMADNGYDISDFEDINPDFGTMEDMDRLITEAKKRGIKVIMDLVLNHSSDEHPWFQEALKDPNSKYRDYYYFKEGKDGKEPTNWRSVFSGSVWEPVEGEDNMYYMHSFAKKQPDLNWENPQLRQELYDMIIRWMDRGVAGFRVDAINYIKKNQDWPDGEPDGSDGLHACFDYTRNILGIEEMLADLRKNAFDKKDCLAVSEAFEVAYPDAWAYVGDKGCFSMMFDFNWANFDVINEDVFRPTNWKVKEVKELIDTSQTELQKLGWDAPFLENHDQPRAVSKWIRNPAYHDFAGPTAIAILYFCLRGTPFIYQGQELGMTNFERKSIEEFDDINAHGQYKRALEEGFSPEEAVGFLNRRSRDNSRTPFPWDDSEYAGFSDHEPWILMNENYPRINLAKEQADPNSVLNFYKKLIALRRNSEISDDLIYADYTPLDYDNENIIAYKRGDILVVVSLSDQIETVGLSAQGKKVWLNNYPELETGQESITLQPYQAVILK